MKIYIQKDGQAAGPYSLEELREKTYTSELSRTTLACPEGGTKWVPLETLFTPVAAAASPAAPPVLAGNLARLRDPKEKTALLWLCIASIPAYLVLLLGIVASFGGALLIIGLVWGARAIGEMWFAAYLKTNAVRVSPTQLPEVFNVVQTCSQRLGMEPPEVYVMQHNIWNAFATKIFGRRMVVLLSGAVDSILLKGDLQQLTWLVGHELGHHWAGHLNLSQRLAKAGAWLVWVALWHSRRCELTCDRVGLYCTGSVKASQLALMNATVGAQLADRVNLVEAIRQWQQHRGEFFVQYRTLYSTHPHMLARLDHMSAAAGEFGMAAEARSVLKAISYQ